MLIVIVIIGILAAALIPRVTGIQARARDTARLADMRDVSTSIEMYMIDHGTYPQAVYVFNSDSSPSLFIPRVFAQSEGSSLETIAHLLTPYLKSLPQDPNGLGTVVTSVGNCVQQGNSYAYYTDAGASLYAITSPKESKKGNSSACTNILDKVGNESHETIGKGLLATTNLFSLKLTAVDPLQKVLTIKLVRQITALSLVEANALVNSVPATINLPMTYDQALSRAEQFHTLGAKIEYLDTGIANTEDPTPEISGLFSVQLTTYDSSKKVAVIKKIRTLKGLSLGEASSLVNSAPVIIEEEMSDSDAQDRKSQLEAVGATIDILPS